jgi:hypothetical protein
MEINYYDSSVFLVNFLGMILVLVYDCGRNIFQFFLQICYYGNAANDLCYLLFTTSSAKFRQEHLNDLLHLYFENLLNVVRNLGLEETIYNPTFEEFEREIL